MTMIVHAVDEERKLQSFVLNIKQMEEAQTGSVKLQMSFEFQEQRELLL